MNDKFLSFLIEQLAFVVDVVLAVYLAVKIKIV
jgi:hypothetical protein